MNENKKKYKTIETLFENPHLNFYHMDAVTNSGRVFDYYFASRNKKDAIKPVTREHKAEGIVIYAVIKGDPDKIVLIRQYRYPVGDYLYELPAGLIDEGETATKAAIREMMEETGFSLTPMTDVFEGYKRPVYMCQGISDEACQTVFGYVTGEQKQQELEDSETIQVLTVDKDEARRILLEEKVSLRCAYLLTLFINDVDLR